MSDAERNRFVREWRKKQATAGSVWGEPWTCPLCNLVLQSTTGPVSTVTIRDHKHSHGADWRAYQAIGHGRS